MKKNPIALMMALTLLLTGCSTTGGNSEPAVTTAAQTTVSSAISDVTSTAEAISSAATAAASEAATTAAAIQTTSIATGKPETITIQYMVRPSLLSAHYTPVQNVARPAQTYEKPADDFSNVYLGAFSELVKDKDFLDMFKKNGFAMYENGGSEYFQIYESNRYAQEANFVTVDSMMHTYHLYFQHLQKNVEKEHLAKELLAVSKQMMAKAEAQYNDLKGSEWESAAKRALGFFTVAAKLQDDSVKIPAAVKDTVDAELKLISAAQEIKVSPLMHDPTVTDEMQQVKEDYSQYKPRGYYDETEQLKKYFKAMMWYGRLGYRSDFDDLNRTALLITMGMEGDALEKWSHIYTVTSFFAGASDDFGFYEFKPLIEAIYGKDASVKSLIGDTAHWKQFMEVCKSLPAPQISSVPTYDSEITSDEDHDAAQKGFRFMGQRFSIDAAAFTQLVYRAVKANDKGEQRLLPTALDFAAALGSDTALQIIKDEGKANYPNYEEQLNKVRKDIQNAPESTWNASLYSSWVYTLLPTLEDKGAAYPAFMQTEAWKKKNLVTFEGSYTELKHDTILYSKQVMGEMGSGPEPDYDDRGYVETEPVVFGRLKSLVIATRDGLNDYGMISAKDKENLGILAELAGQLETIANKELAKENLTDVEFDLIRSYGGQLEHFWEEVMKADFPDEAQVSPYNHPAAIVADIATDPNGKCLEVGTGNASTIYVVAEVNGKLKLCSGAAFSFYEFEQPIAERMTDKEWRVRQGYIFDGDFSKKNYIDMPKWEQEIIKPDENNHYVPPMN